MKKGNEETIKISHNNLNPKLNTTLHTNNNCENMRIFGKSGGYSGRNKIIDIVKGIGIILMVFRHTEAPFSDFLLLFHMAIFFIASGFCFKENRVLTLRNLLHQCTKKFKALWLPFAVYSSLFYLFNNFFLRINIYTDNPSFLVEYTGRYPLLVDYATFSESIKNVISAVLMRGYPQVGGALWFLQTLLYVNIGYSCICFALHKICKNKSSTFIINGIISMIFLIIGYFCFLNDIYAQGLNRFFSCYWLVYFGHVLNHYNLLRIIDSIKHSIIYLIISIGCLLIAYNYGTIGLAGNNIHNPLFYVIVSILGWIFMYSLSWILNEISFCGNGLLTYISIHSMPIIALHFLAFKIVNWIAVEYYNLNYYMIAAYPVLVHGAWCLLYLVAGIGIPLLFEKIFRTVTNFISSLIER